MLGGETFKVVITPKVSSNSVALKPDEFTGIRSERTGDSYGGELVGGEGAVADSRYTVRNSDGGELVELESSTVNTRHAAWDGDGGELIRSEGAVVNSFYRYPTDTARYLNIRWAGTTIFCSVWV